MLNACQNLLGLAENIIGQGKTLPYNIYGGDPNVDFIVMKDLQKLHSDPIGG
ncbi:MAG: hypothetical protein WDA53_06225 [Bacillota bacterium]